jgi:hypothetical protein
VAVVAKNKLMPTVKELQRGALQLLDQMIALGRRESEDAS